MWIEAVSCLEGNKKMWYIKDRLAKSIRDGQSKECWDERQIF